MLAAERPLLLLAALAICAASFVPAPARAAELPPENDCPVVSGRAPAGAEVSDAVPTKLREGMALGLDDLFVLEKLVPEEVWQHREVFFYEGMRLEIGPCHRRYPFPAFWTRATEKFNEKASLDADANLSGYVAGVPFPPETIDDGEPQAGAKWAWNLEHRYRGAGPVGRFKLLDMPSRVGSPETYLGNFFHIVTAHRADLPASGYVAPDSQKKTWVAGGRFTEPFNARHLAWRQFRTPKAATRYQQPDETFVYVPTMRKPRRAAATWVDGLYVPRYRVSGDAGGGPLPFGSTEAGGPAGTIQPTAGLSIAATEHIRRGFVGLALRPNAYEWSYLGAREVLAPLNGEHPGWPGNPDRNYGPSGLSVASDRWDVRYAIVIEGKARRPMEGVGYVKLYIDYQTQQPLYYISRRENRLLLDVGILVHRYSGDTHAYPIFPDETPADVFDPVAAAFFATDGTGTGWRRESYDVRSVPVDAKSLRNMTSIAELTQGR